MPENNSLSKPHIKFEGSYQNLVYKYPKDPMGAQLDIANRNRARHGQVLLNQLEIIQRQYKVSQEVELREDLVKSESIYVEFSSAWGYELKFESLDKDSNKKANYQLLNVRHEQKVNESVVQHRYHATVLLREGGISDFIKKVEAYLTENIFKTDRVTKERIDTGNPQNYALLDNIQLIQLATLEAFWTDSPEIPFPEAEESIWWEVWFRKTDNDQERLSNVFNNLKVLGCTISISELELTEHKVRLVKGSKQQLSQSLLLLDNLAELRKPQEIADFINHKDVSYEDKEEYLQDLINRTEAHLTENSVLICVLDSGVNNAHPLIFSFLPEENRYTFNDSWGADDSASNGGHGTGVTSLALYGDLVDALSSNSVIRIYHGIESFKIFHENDPNDPKLYGVITETAANTPFVDRPNNLRVFCMTITDKNFAFKGRPSAWSASIDKITFGSSFEPSHPQMFILSSGNVYIFKHNEYLTKNVLEIIHDPAQAYNALCVGTYTRKDRIDVSTGLRPLAINGGMSPSNSTSLLWDSQWPNKPDVVFEGGNLSTDGIDTSDHPSLKLLAADAEFPNFLFLPFGDTSGAAGLASKMAAELRTKYPGFWPETIRGLIIHTASWTNTMLGGRSINMHNEQQKRSLLRTFGYGVPVFEKAMYSGDNSLTLIAERTIQPYRKEGSLGKYNEYHLFELPWPTDILRDLEEVNATLTITLSYYIEPNPGTKRYSYNFHYHSHSLDFAVIKPREKLEIFQRRVSAATQIPEDEINNLGEPWVIGRSGSRGSVRKDFITMSAVEMSERNIIAIYPKGGWYKTRKKLNRFNSIVRYSLIVSIETEGADIYTPVVSMIPAENLL